MADGHKWQVDKILSKISDSDQRRMLEYSLDDDEWQRREANFHPSNTEFGQRLETPFSMSVFPWIEWMGDDELRVVINMNNHQGFDANIEIKRLAKWIVVELKNWHKTKEVSPDNMNTNFYYKKPVFTYRGQRRVLTEDEILHKFLIIAGGRLGKGTLQKIRDTPNLTLIQADEWFESEKNLTSDNMELIFRAYITISDMIGKILDREHGVQLNLNPVYLLHLFIYYYYQLSIFPPLPTISNSHYPYSYSFAPPQIII